MTEKKYPANRALPRSKLNLEADFLVKHWDTIRDFTRTAQDTFTSDPMDIVAEMCGGRPTGKLLFVHSGHSTIMAQFIKKLKEEDPID